MFCHRCGRPLREISPGGVEPEPQPAEVLPAETAALLDEVAAVPAPINFHNGSAVRVGFLAATIVQLAVTLAAAAGASILMPLMLFAGGFYSVFLYRRRTGEGVSIRNGARIGWMTGVFSFVIMTVLFTVGMAALAGSDQLLKAYKDSAANLGLPPDSADQMQKLLNDPGALALSIVLGLAIQFLFLTLLCSVGGAVGARLNPERKS